jgi:purine-cytosine permease-like protein
LGMVFSPGTLLRWLAAICLAVSVGMVVAGESLLKERLRAEAFIYYWLVCISFTFLTMVIALVDFWMVRRRLHREQKELFQEALRAIAHAGGDTEEQQRWLKGDF